MEGEPVVICEYLGMKTVRCRCLCLALLSIDFAQLGNLCLMECWNRCLKTLSPFRNWYFQHLLHSRMLKRKPQSSFLFLLQHRFGQKNYLEERQAWGGLISPWELKEAEGSLQIGLRQYTVFPEAQLWLHGKASLDTLIFTMPREKIKL